VNWLSDFIQHSPPSILSIAARDHNEIKSTEQKENQPSVFYIRMGFTWCFLDDTPTDTLTNLTLFA